MDSIIGRARALAQARPTDGMAAAFGGVARRAAGCGADRAHAGSGPTHASESNRIGLVFGGSTARPAWAGGERPRTRSPSNEVFASTASAWEIAAKPRLGKLDGAPEATRQRAALAAADSFARPPIAYLHALRAGAYAHEHRDPFDRMLAAQSEPESLVLVTCDEAFEAFDCQALW